MKPFFKTNLIGTFLLAFVLNLSPSSFTKAIAQDELSLEQDECYERNIVVSQTSDSQLKECDGKEIDMNNNRIESSGEDEIYNNNESFGIEDNDESSGNDEIYWNFLPIIINV